MPAHMKKHRTEKTAEVLWHGIRFLIPLKVMEKYKVLNDKKNSLTIEETFADLIDTHGEPGVLLKGLRAKEGLTQIKFAKAIGVTQANLSAMENGKRPIGKEIAKRIAKKFKVDYRVFL